MDAAGEEAGLFQRLRRSEPVARQRLLVVLGAGGHVEVKADAEAVGDLDLGLQQVLGIVDIGGVRTEPGDDAPIGRALLLEEGRGFGQLLLAARLVAQLHDAVGDDGADAGALDGGRDLLGEEILVAEGRGARKQHLGRRRAPRPGRYRRKRARARARGWSCTSLPW